ncbi:hypothetical protein P43SY_000826 [Pythium insidiosum]|uniref:Aminotransferase class I/classII large domain-containing protein n=1 Tax=Pythium insidiosum TaxID=114742 RepID=A0AAD5LGH7_PYTIN|nr:hypothetical protein P43SY_000826 [Pythium insidiosum]
MAAERTTLEKKLRKALARRATVGTLRSLVPADVDCIDFYSNDYLGLAKSARLTALIASRRRDILERSRFLGTNGSTGSRLISGNSEYFMQVERELAAFYGSEAALLFNSGYSANVGVMSSLPQADDVVLFDELVHNSCHEGIRLSRAYAKNRAQSFRHNDLSDLEQKLKAAARGIRGMHEKDSSDACIFVVVESVYSMDGDAAPLVQMTALCERYGAFMIVDEAHGVGVYGPQGSGLVRALGVERRSSICCRVYTFGKAMGCHGAVVCGSATMIDYLVNYARSFIYTTAFPLEQLITVQCAHEVCAQADEERARVLELVQYFKRGVASSPLIPSSSLLDSDSPIQGVVFSGNHEVLDAAKAMLAMGIRVIPIRSPTVPRGSERFRIIIHADNSEPQIDQLVAALAAMFQRRRPSARL